jgi:hypothetical protein
MFSATGVELQHDLQTLRQKGENVVPVSKVLKFLRVKEFMYLWFQAHGEHLNSLIGWFIGCFVE